MLILQCFGVCVLSILLYILLSCLLDMPLSTTLAICIKLVREGGALPDPQVSVTLLIPCSQ